MKVNPRLAAIASKIFKVNPRELSLRSSTDTIEKWDSLSHLQFILKVEQKFGVKFLTREIPEFTSLDRLQKSLDKKGVL